jgi:putative DeoR family transcriptional regulator (stage III sporulation protein D)
VLKGVGRMTNKERGEIIERRIKEEINLLLNDHLTVREIAKKLGVSKSLVHHDLINTPEFIDMLTYIRIRSELVKHFDAKHINGGIATQRKWLARKNGTEIVNIA